MNRLRNLVSIWPGVIAATFLALSGNDAAAQIQLLHPTNTVWRYQTNLAEQQAASTDWINPGFDDSAWPQGVGLFGNEAGYPYPMNTTGAGLAGGFPLATYFRAHFTWSGSTSGVVLVGTNYVDDGSIIYLNGVEVARFNMPATANAGTPEALAPAANPGGYPNVNGGEPVIVQLQIDLSALTNGNANPLIPGDNVVAVQVHQSGLSSADRVFGLALYAAQCAPPCFSTTGPIQPTNRVVLEGRSTTFTAVETCAFPRPAFQWYRDIGAGEELIPGATAASYTLTNALVSDSGVYYVKATSTSALCGGTATSRPAVLTVIPDPQPPKLLSGRLGANDLEIIVTADEPLCPDDSCAGNATYSFNYEIFVEGDEVNQLAIATVAVNGNILTFALDASTPWVTDTRYVIRLQLFDGGSIGDLYGNLLNGGDPFSSVTAPAAASAISVRAPFKQSDLYTFDLAPYSTEFSTFPIPGASQDAFDVVSLNAAAQTISAMLVATPLPTALGDPPGVYGLALYGFTAKSIITRPGGVLGNVVMARLRNDTGQAGSFLGIRYTLASKGSSAEEIAGHLVLYSLSGAPGTWLPIPNLSGDGTPGAKSSGAISLGKNAWVPGSFLYVLWVDDNGPSSPDTAYEIDNIQFTLCGVDCGDLFNCSYPTVIEFDNSPFLVRAFAPNNTTIILTFSERLAATATTTAPYAVSGATVTAAAFNNADRTEVILTTTPRAVGSAAVTITGLKLDRFCESVYNLISPNPTVVNITTVSKIVNWNASWEYNTNNLDSAPTWKTTGGTGWQTGNALFGTESSGGVVAIMPTPIATVIPPPNTNNEFMVSYFRKAVTLPALAAGQSYAIGYLIDDGAVFYLDGVEVGRVNMPAGPVGYATNALAGIEGSPQALPFTATAGDHVLAVEVHQNVNTSSDTLFGASVLVVPTTSPSLSIAPVGTNVMVSWNADSSWVLVNSTNVAGPYTAVPGAAPPSYSRPRHVPATLFYKLNYVPQP